MNTCSILVLVILQALSVCSQGVCTLPSGNEGICTPIKQCLSALALLKAGTKAKVCGEADGLPLVCCDQRSIQLTEQGPGTKAEKQCSEFVNYLVKKFEGSYPSYNGEFSLAMEFPHMAALGFEVDDKIVWGCGGSLISDKFVLTAAHCISNKNLGEVKQVRLGDLNLVVDTDDADPQNFQVANVFKHPNYKFPYRYNDIALIELNQTAKETYYVHIACLNTDPSINPEEGFVATGWGLLKFAGEPADHLQKVKLNAISFEECKKYYPPERKLNQSILDDMQLCAGHPNRDTCEGDSGGPLQRRITFEKTSVPQLHIVYGVTSFGKACGLSATPGVYTRVSNYIDWIESIVWPAALGFKVDDKIVWGCGGSLISDKFVLTAAHCIANKNLGEVKQVRLGDLNLALDTDNARPEDFQVANVYRHPDYKSPSRYNDIALIKLNRSVDSTIYAHMACLNTDPNVNPDGGLIATGWGLLKFAGEPADHLQKLELNLVNFEECNKHYPPERKLDKGILDDSQLCAGHPSRDTCEGDSGGPLQRFIHFDRTSIPRVHTVYGVTSFGKACGLSSSPGVYTRVSNNQILTRFISVEPEMNTYLLLIIILQTFSAVINYGQGICSFSNDEDRCTPIKEFFKSLTSFNYAIQAKFQRYEKGLNNEQIGVKAERYCDHVIDELRELYEADYPVVGGEIALSEEFPHMAALGFKVGDKIVWGCGGSLISDKFVLTAAHCIINKDFGEVKNVRLGDVDLMNDDDFEDYYSAQNFQVTNAYVHPDYRSSLRYNDIGLIELNASAIFTDRVRVCCLNTKPYVNPYDGFKATGWGLLKFLGEPAEQLQKVDLDLVSWKDCRQFYPPDRRLNKGVLDDLQICAGHQGRDTCQGDSGGPLQRIIPFHRSAKPKLYTLFGVTSFGKACGLSASPGVYTRVSKYIGWIESIVWPN
ncbi:PREDICTED: uncharacterized protein LOC108557798 [Nicrophorus vespilloides]|uniref:Uncharacterized protein LOC108557798 n=1 Tax=Nicrophorus vespilloides TaxID=110193 RepID=A0ABM1M5V0_NICVS|nr:PREDICTED: uncharacterized protein LOC108557798 [Nicrophorus vespilloides]